MFNFEGLKVHMYGAIVYKGYGFFFYENTKTALINNNFIQNRKVLIFLSGSVAGLFAQLISYPFDVLKKNMQAAEHNRSM